MRTDLPKWLTEAHLRREGAMRKTIVHPQHWRDIDADTERQIGELREARKAENRVSFLGD